MLKGQQELQLSPYSELYNILVPSDHQLRLINELIDFTFVYQELKDKYSPSMGRTAEDPIRMFRYLLLKALYPSSDRGLVSRAYTDMAFKFFLGLSPESPVIDASSLSKFRRQRLKDCDLLDLLVGKTVQLAVDMGIIKSKSLVIDATHTCSKYNPLPPIEVLRVRSCQLRKTLYKMQEEPEEYKKSMPEKNLSSDLVQEIAYSRELIAFVRKDELLARMPNVEEGLNYLEETIEDIEDHFTLSADKEARVGHKTADDSFLGYKTHIAMTTDRIITAAVVTTGEKNDGKQLGTLVEKSRENLGGVDKVDTVLADTAYSGDTNLKLAHDKEKGFKLVSKVNPMLYKGNEFKDDGFELNKDAGMYVCPAGHMAISKRKKYCGKGKNDKMIYSFDPQICACCKRRETCLSPGCKQRNYHVSIASPDQKEQMAFEKTEEFMKLARDRYMIEAKNSEIKNNLGYDVALSYGINSMCLQGAITIFASNLRRIIRLMGK